MDQKNEITQLLITCDSITHSSVASGFIAFYISKNQLYCMFIACDRCGHQKSLTFSTHISRITSKITFLLQIYNKRIVKTNQGNNMKTVMSS